MTRLLWRTLELVSGRRFVPTQAMLDAAPPGSPAYRAIADGIRAGRAELR